VPKSLLSSKLAVVVAVAATVAGVSAVVLLSGQTSPAQAAAAPGSTVRASVGNGDPPPTAGGTDQELSADGTTVVFASYGNYDELDTGEGQGVYVRDLRNNRTVLISRGQFTRIEPPPPTTTTTTPTTTTTTPPCCPIGLAGEPLLSMNGAQPDEPEVEFGEITPNGSSSQPTISGDGRYVAFVTYANNIVLEDDDDDQDILVCDRDPDGDGVFDEPRAGGSGLDYRYFRVNEPQYVGEGSYRVDYPGLPKLSDDASRIVWEDTFVNDAGQYFDVVRTASLQAVPGAVVGPGPVENVETVLGEDAPRDQYSPDVSANGQFIVLVADYVRIEGDIEFPIYFPFHAVIRKDMESGAVLRVDWDENTTPAEITYLSSDESVDFATPAISGDGGEIAFVAEELEDTCSEGCWNSVANQPMVYVVRMTPDGAPVDSAVVSRDNAGQIVNGIRPALSGDGRFLAFATDNLNVHDGVDAEVPEGTDNCIIDNSDLRGQPMVNLSGLPPTSESRDRRTECQIVVRDLVVDRARGELPRLPGTLVSAGIGTDCGEGGTCTGDNDSPPFRRNAPSLSHNGSTVAFDSRATNLVERDDNQQFDVFVRTFKPELRAAPTPLEYGEVQIGDTVDQVVRFDHVGMGPLVISEIVVDGSDEFAVGAQTCSGEGVVLQQTGTCEVSVTFAPTATGARTGTLHVTLRDGREFTVPLTGKGSIKVDVKPIPRFAAGPDPLAFGDRLLLSDGPTQTVTVTNLGGAPLTVTSVTVVSALAPTDYTFPSDTCTGKPVAPKSTCQVTVKFSPAEPGDRPAVLRFVDDAPGAAVHLIGMSGKGSTPTLIVSPGVSPPGRVVTVTGAGFAPNRPVTITIPGSTELVPAVADATGAFSQGLLILPKSPIGSRPVTATIDGTTLKAERPLLIVTPSVSPGEFVGRG
jgi:hypothetical protein